MHNNFILVCTISMYVAPQEKKDTVPVPLVVMVVEV